MVMYEHEITVIFWNDKHPRDDSAEIDMVFDVLEDHFQSQTDRDVFLSSSSSVSEWQ